MSLETLDELENPRWAQKFPVGSKNERAIPSWWAGQLLVVSKMRDL
jgi:hypothetical protein